MPQASPKKSSDLRISTLRNLSIASISDIHLGHRRNPTRSIIQNLEVAFGNNAETAKLDIIFIAGDVFDNLLTVPDDDITDIKFWITKLLTICKTHDIVLRVLEGTPSHDWKQSRLFETINEITQINADVKHVTALSIEHMDRFGIDVLYVPDEWESSTDKTFEQVLALMSDRGISKVDFAIMHGQFDYQLPPGIKAQKHNVDNYLSIVKEYIFIGHVHIFSVHQRAIAQGSFDRLSQGEEGPKGHVRVFYNDVGESSVKFIENKNAKIFKTIDVTGLSQDELLSKVTKIVRDLPDHSFVRIEAEKENPIFATFEVLIRHFPMITWSKLARDLYAEEENEFNIINDDEDDFVPIYISRDNIVPLLMDRIQKTSIPDEVLQRSKELLTECI